MLNELSGDELEIAARTSYQYVTNPTIESKKVYAGEMAKRYLSSKSDKILALAKMKSTINFRKEIDIDTLKDAAYNPKSDSYIPLRKFLSNGKLYISGYDNEGRSTYTFLPRLVEDHDPEWTIKGHVWSMERAIACSKANDKTVNAVIDFNGFSSLRHTPPLSVGKHIMLILRHHYVGHMNQIFMVDAPVAFLYLWKLLMPFTGKKTREKVQFITSAQEHEQVISSLYSSNHAHSWMLRQGLKNEDLEFEQYYFNTPFDGALNE
jgi:CRAL/TRIO domain